MKFLNNENRAELYKSILNESGGNIFISGLSLTGVLSQSIDFLRSKLEEGFNVRVLLMDPLFAKDNKDLIKFNPSIFEDINKSLSILDSLNYKGLEVKLYSTFMPIVVTGYLNGNYPSSLVYEVVDYLENSNSPISHKVEQEWDLETFETIYNKFSFYWNNSNDYLSSKGN